MDLHIDKNESFKAQMEEQKEQRVFYLSAAVCAVFVDLGGTGHAPVGVVGI